jgi:hypothetical protein
MIDCIGIARFARSYHGKPIHPQERPQVAMARRATGLAMTDCIGIASFARSYHGKPIHP